MEALELIEQIKSDTGGVRTNPCRHVMPNGSQCGSPALRDEKFCYYHHPERKPVADPQLRQARRNSFYLTAPASRAAIQESLGQILTRIASNDLDTRRAGLLLYGLQIACTNLSGQQQDNNHLPAPGTQPEQEQTAQSQPAAPPTEGELYPISRATFGALLEALARHRGDIPSSEDEDLDEEPALGPAADAPEPVMESSPEPVADLPAEPTIESPAELTIESPAEPAILPTLTAQAIPSSRPEGPQRGTEPMPLQSMALLFPRGRIKKINEATRGSFVVREGFTDDARAPHLATPHRLCRPVVLYKSFAIA